MEIKILGGGCQKCKKLEENVALAIKEFKDKITITKITDFKEIMKFGVMTTPALVINEKVVSYGKINPINEIIELIKNG